MYKRIHLVTTLCIIFLTSFDKFLVELVANSNLGNNKEEDKLLSAKSDSGISYNHNIIKVPNYSL